MPERYPCGQCDLDFNFRIKLNRHIAKVHSVVDAEPFFLKPEASLTDDEKLKYFDDLQKKFDNLCDKYKSYEKRFDYLQTRLRTLAQQRNKPKKKQVKNYKGSVRSGAYEDIDIDPTIPEGWKSSYRLMDAFGKTRKHKIYWAPNGRHCTSRRDALNYMTDLNSSQEDFERMKNGLLTDGWMEDSSLPKGWLMMSSDKESSSGQISASKQFITADFQRCKNAKIATKHLLLNNSEQELSKFISAQFLRSEVTPSNISWLKSESIPYPWKAATTTSDAGIKGQLLISPEGLVYTNVKTAWEIIEKSGEMGKAEIERLSSFMGEEKYKEEIACKDWIRDNKLPEGWMKLNKAGHGYYMSPKGETFGTRVGVLEHLKRSSDNTFDEKTFTVAVKKELVWKEDETAPKGWTSAINEETLYSTGKRFKDPTGKYFFNRIDALRYIAKEKGYENEEVTIMKEGLVSDGWTIIPAGWMMKKRSYLSPTFEMIYTMETVIKLMRENGTTEEEIKEVKEKSILKWRSKDNLPEGWMVSFNAGKSWIKHYMDPSGKFFLCLPQALKHLSSSGDQAKIDQMRPLLFEEGWESEDSLPGGTTGGWLYKRKHDNRFMFLSPTYDRFKNTKIFIKYLKENCFKQEEIIKFERHMKLMTRILPAKDSVSKPLASNEVSSKVISTLKWTEHESLPKGWKLAQTGNKFKRLLSPKGECFLNRGEAFKSLLMDASSEQNDIEKIKSGLFEDGWETADFLPENWLRRVGEKWHKAIYLTPTGDQITSMEKVLIYMRDNGYSIEEMDRFKANCYSVKFLDDETLPYGWKYGLAPIKSGFKIKRYLSPEGKIFNNRALAMKYMLENKCNSEEIIKMKRGFDLDGWSQNENLPEGWKMKQKVRNGKVQYMTPSYETIDGARGLLDHLEKSNFSSSEISKVRRFVKKYRMENRKTANITHTPKRLDFSVPEQIQSLLPTVTFSKIQVKKENDPKISKVQVEKESDSYALKDLDWKDQDSLPAGWKSALITSNLSRIKSKKVRKFLSPDGKFLNSRAQCLRYMLEKKDDFRKKDIEKMKRSLPKDGWRKKDSLPPNWMTRPVGKSSLFLNPKFEQIKSLRNALKYMEKCGYDAQTIEKARISFFRVPQDEGSSIVIPEEENIQVHEEQKILPVKDIDDSSNDSLSSGKNQAFNLEWSQNKTLPRGWKCAFIPSALKHQAEGSKIMKLMSPCGKYLNSKVQALKFMSANEKTFTNKDIGDMKVSMAEEGWFVDKALPDGWMMKHVQHTYMFMTPEFDTLKSQKKALAYMEMKKYDAALIQKAKASFGGNRLLNDETSIESETGKETKAKVGFSQTQKEVKTSIENIKSVSPLKRKCSEIENESIAKLAESDMSVKKQKWGKFTKGRNDKDWSKGDETLPAGWKIRIEKISNTFQMLSPSGNVFSSRSEALKYMFSNPDFYSNNDIEAMKTRLHHEAWEDHALLPEGWKLKKHHGGAVIFLTEKGICMKTANGARDNLRRRNDTSAVENFNKLLDELKPINRKHEVKDDAGTSLDPLSLVTANYNNIKQEPDLSLVKKEKMENIKELVGKKETEKSQEPKSKVRVKSEPVTYSEPADPSIPSNWTIQTSSDGNETIITSSQGKTFSSRLSAVEFLIKSKSDPQTIYNLWNTLDTEGWIIGDELLPPGWRVKFHKKIFDYKYLTREMSIIHSTEVALKLVIDSSDYTSENVNNFKQWSEEVSKSKPKLTWMNDSSLPSGWMLSSGLPNEVIKDGKGGLFGGRKEAIDHMIKEHFSPSDIFSLWNTLHLEGWISDEDNLPTGWKRKFFTELDKHHYLSPMMDVVKSTEALLDIVEKGKEYTGEEVARVKNWLKITK